MDSSVASELRSRGANQWRTCPRGAHYFLRQHLKAQNNVRIILRTRYCACEEVLAFIQSPKAFADFGRSHRIGDGITQEDLSLRTGMSRRWVQEVESGKIVPSLEAALSVVAAFG